VDQHFVAGFARYVRSPQYAVHLVDGLYEGGTSDPGAGRALGLALAQLSEKKCLLNDFDQAGRAAQRAVDIFERLSKSDPENAQYMEAAARELLGDILKNGPSMHEALAEYRESLALTERLKNADSSNTELRLTLLRAYDRVAVAVAHLGNGDEAKYNCKSYVHGRLHCY
jgi:hypothetical protein